MSRLVIVLGRDRYLEYGTPTGIMWIWRLPIVELDNAFVIVKTASSIVLSSLKFSFYVSIEQEAFTFSSMSINNSTCHKIQLFHVTNTLLQLIYPNMSFLPLVNRRTKSGISKIQKKGWNENKRVKIDKYFQTIVTSMVPESKYTIPFQRI